MLGTDTIDMIRGVGPALAKLYAKIGITTVEQLVNYYPRTYDDYSQVAQIKDTRPGPVTIQATIEKVKSRYVRRGMHITEAIACDVTGAVHLVWFNQPYRATAIKSDQQYFVSGVFELSHQRFTIISPSIELVSTFPVNTARIVPIYKETKGLTSIQIRKAIAQALSYVRALPETLPEWLIVENELISHSQAVEWLHFPANADDLSQARTRLGFEEVFELITASFLNKYEIMAEHAPAVPFIESVAKDFVANLPFQLTDAQRRTIWQIYLDMQKTHPMNRLVEGDVGSGKTVVAAMAAVMVLHHKHQVALMAPTEILARQHAETLTRLLQPLGLDAHVGLLVGGMNAAQKTRAHTAITKGQMRFIVGTHALIQDKVDMHELELIIIDEQHRFGVEQRKALIAKAGHMPHVLNLTATPIPRSLALTLYGELDVSILDTKPANRQPIRTTITAPTSRKAIYESIRAELDAGRQMFVVTPLITDSEVHGGPSAEATYEQMKTKEFKKYRLGLLHGKMKPTEKNDVMQQFINYELDILVSTTVIEVGVDVPNASVMLIEGADRFGLAQIHQLRGRIGRGQHPGFCYLMMSDARAPSPRLRALERTNDGFKLAELDLELRGPGAIYGLSQHGQLDLRIAKLTDMQLITRARRGAQQCIDTQEDLTKFPGLYANIRRLRAVTNLN
jgi:ATP-dependent DNA helicase RecG